jgi:hypothetical protein
LSNPADRLAFTLSRAASSSAKADDPVVANLAWRPHYR